MKTAYVYARFSSDNQREESIDAQLRAIHEYCDLEDITILREFVDEAFSARTDKRPAFQRLFGLIQDAPADLLIVHKLDRFARNRYDAAFYRAKLKECGMKLVSVLERMDDSPESIIMEGLLESMNEYYSANLAREVRKGQRENVLKGRRNGVRPPTGYDSIDQRLVPNADAQRVRRVFEMYADGKPQRAIMDATGFPDYMISHIVRNEAYVGTLVFGDVRCENAHEAIIDRATWEEAQKRVHSASMNAANKAKRTYILSGLLVCGRCGKAMCGCPVKGYSYYGCRTRGCKSIRKELLERSVIESLSECLSPTEDLRNHLYEILRNRESNGETSGESHFAENGIGIPSFRIARTGESHGQSPAELKALKTGIEKRISSLLKAVQYAENEEDVKSLMAEVKKLRAQIPEMPPENVNVRREDVDAFCDKFFRLDGKTPEEQKVILHRALKRITVHVDRFVLDTNIEGGGSIAVNKKRPARA